MYVAQPSQRRHWSTKESSAQDEAEFYFGRSQTGPGNTRSIGTNSTRAEAQPCLQLRARDWDMGRQGRGWNGVVLPLGELDAPTRRPNVSKPCNHVARQPIACALQTTKALNLLLHRRRCLFCLIFVSWPCRGRGIFPAIQINPVRCSSYPTERERFGQTVRACSPTIALRNLWPSGELPVRATIRRRSVDRLFHGVTAPWVSRCRAHLVRLAKSLHRSQACRRGLFCPLCGLPQAPCGPLTRRAIRGLPVRWFDMIVNVFRIVRAAMRRGQLRFGRLLQMQGPG
ncbi:uncharacterized protein IWZ02DRAFT_72480 [Phyllosticta citriasiana]|uniref:uncharacterized protein n=1 Tax=Phyllosticta citriasiana TaxID=595635 RepID=UPI0030FDEA98